MIWNLQLDLNFNPYPLTTNLKYKQFIFSGGEVHFQLTPDVILADTDKVMISTRIHNSEDLMVLVMAVNALKENNIVGKNISVMIPYLPYARQDRICNKGEPLSVKVFSSIINSLGVGKVTILDAHSDVTPALIDNCNNVSNHLYVEMAIKHTGKDLVLVSPDAGSSKKINKLNEYLKTYKPVVQCEKVRDLETGNLSGFKVYADDIEGKDCIIVDDICDGGGTFIGLAEELKHCGVNNLYLFVTHGIFSKGFGELKKYFSGIYSTNSFVTQHRAPIHHTFDIQFHI